MALSFSVYPINNYYFERMKPLKPVLTLAALLLLGIYSVANSAENLRCEYLVNPLGIDVPSPRLSWIITSNRRGEMQTAYQILVASSSKLLSEDKGDLWDSGKVSSDESSQIAYSGSLLASRENCFWKVRTWDSEGKPGDWSQVARWSMGLLQPADWSAQWISPAPPVKNTNGLLVIRRAT